MLERSFPRPTVNFDQMQTAKPKFVTKLKGTTELIENDHAHFECQIEPINDPELIVEILHNGKPLKTGSRFQTICEFGYIALDIYSINSEDSGEYQFKISNPLGFVEDSILLNVTPIKSIQTDTIYEKETLKKLSRLDRGPSHRQVSVDEPTNQPPIFTQPLHEITRLHEGSNAHLECRLMPIGDSSLKVEWFKDGKPLPSSSRYHLMNDFGFISLDIHKTEAKDSGTYQVRATNELGEAQTVCILEVSGKR